MKYSVAHFVSPTLAGSLSTPHSLGGAEREALNAGRKRGPLSGGRRARQSLFPTVRLHHPESRLLREQQIVYLTSRDLRSNNVLVTYLNTICGRDAQRQAR